MKASGFSENTAVWDYDGMLKRVRGKEGRVIKLVTMFLTGTPERMHQLRQAIDSEDVKEVAEIAHGIKGVAGNLGANALMDVMKTIEFAGKESDQATLLACWPEAELVLQTLMTHLKQYLEDAENRGEKSV